MSTMLTLPVTKTRVALFGVVILATTLAGCMVPPPVAPAQAPAATATSAPTATTVMATAAPAAMGTMVMLSENGELGKFLVDDKGMTLYLFTKDEKNVSNCYDQCEAAWPVLFTEGAPQAGEGVDAALLGTTTRKDGKTQVTYNGWPLYYYIKDMKAGDVTGQEVGDVWYVLSPAGEMIEAQAAEAPAAVGTMVMLGENDELGKFLVDDKGMTLYLFTKDEKNVSNCYDQCEAAWPVLFTEGAPQAGEGVDAALLGTTTRKDGKTQVTYNGWPLYYYIKDMKAGDVTGQEVGDVWYVLSPAGEMIEGAKAGAEGTMVKVAIKDFSFGAPVTIKVGTTVEWTNEDSAAHTVTAANDAFDSGNMDQNATFSFTFTEAGTFDYICTYHPNMKGQVVVTQ